MKIAVAAGLIAMSLSSTSPAATIADGIKADMPQLMALYRDIHANPELSMQEVRTPAKLAAEMRKLGFEVTEHVGKTGVVAVMKNGRLVGTAPTGAVTKDEVLGMIIMAKVPAGAVPGPGAMIS